MWYFIEGNAQAGPVDDNAIKAKIAAGQLTPESYVWKEGMPEWLPVKKTELAAFFTAPARAGGFSLKQRDASPAPAQGPAPQAPFPQGPAPGSPVFASQRDLGNAPGAVEALVYGIIGLFCCGLILGVVAISKAKGALEAIKENPGYSGKGMAIAGIVLGIIDIIGWAAGLAVRVLMQGK